jgi:predicted NBD/HSP70 family sugar kinase
MGTLWTEVQLLKPDQNLAPDAHAARSVIARMIADGESVSRREIVKTTGLARSTIDGHLGVLLDAGLIEDGGMGGSGARGRPAQVFKVSARRGVVLIADVSVETTRLAIATLDKVVVDRRELTMRVDVGPIPLLTAITETFEEMLESNDLAPGNSLAMSIGLPGPVDSHVGYAVRPPMMPGWDGFSICRFMAERFRCDVIVDNDVNLMALGAARAYGGGHLPLLMIHIGTGVGAGFVSESGLLLHGADGAAADIGHIQMREMSDVLCNCGNRGCLEAVASVGAMAARLSQKLGEPVSSGELIDRLVLGEATAVNIVRETAIILGRAIADLVNFCNPARIVIGGAVTECTEDILAQIRSVVYQQAQPLATRNLSVVHSALGSEAGLIGGMISGIEQVLSPRGIQYHTRPTDSEMLPLGL